MGHEASSRNDRFCITEKPPKIGSGPLRGLFLGICSAIAWQSPLGRGRLKIKIILTCFHPFLEEDDLRILCLSFDF